MLFRLQVQGVLVRLSAIGWALSQNVAGPHILGIAEFGEFVRALVLVYIFTALGEAVIVPSLIKRLSSASSQSLGGESAKDLTGIIRPIGRDTLIFLGALVAFIVLIGINKSEYVKTLLVIVLLCEYLFIQFPIAIGYTFQQFRVLTAGFLLATLSQLGGMYLLAELGAMGALIATSFALALHIAVLLTNKTIRGTLLIGLVGQSCRNDPELRLGYMRLISGKSIQIFSFSGVLLIFSIGGSAESVGDLKLMQTVVSAGSQALPISQEAFQVWLSQTAGIPGKDRIFWYFVLLVFLAGSAMSGAVYFIGSPVFLSVFSRSLEQFSGLAFAIPFVAIAGLFVSKLYTGAYGSYLTLVSIIIIPIGAILAIECGPVISTIFTLSGFVCVAGLYLGYISCRHKV